MFEFGKLKWLFYIFLLFEIRIPDWKSRSFDKLYAFGCSFDKIIQLLQCHWSTNWISVTLQKVECFREDHFTLKLNSGGRELKSSLKKFSFGKGFPTKHLKTYSLNFVFVHYIEANSKSFTPFHEYFWKILNYFLSIVIYF